MIKYPKTFRRFRPIAYDGYFDWDFLLEAFKGTNITPTDIDFLVERNYKFLIIETKSPGKNVPKGQVLALERLLKLGKGQLVVFVLWGKVPTEIKAMEEWHCVSGDITKIRWDRIDAQFVLSRVIAWRQWAEK
jgi:hypothetical protein